MNAGNKAQNPFSRSAAKRESVMALGSIEHLQYYFTKTGIAAKKNPKKQLKGLVPALGGMQHIRTTSSSISGFELPPTPVIPSINRPAFPPFVKTYETDPESLLPGVVDDLNAVARAWSADETSAFDVLMVLKLTTNAVRSVRNYVVSLPDESAGTIRAQYRSKAIGPGSPRLEKAGAKDSDPLTLIRGSALEVLTVLRALEEKSRLPLDHDAYDAQSDGRQSRNGNVASPASNHEELPPTEPAGDGLLHVVDQDTAVSFSLVQVQGRYESVPVWEDEDGGELSEEEEAKRDVWDERLVLGSGWLYRQDVSWEELTSEKEVVGHYLDVVDEVLFEGKKDDGKRGWEHKAKKVDKANRRRVSAGVAEGQSLGLMLGGGMLDVHITEEPESLPPDTDTSIDDDDLPAWARRDAFVDDELGRAYDLITSLLPPALAAALAPASSRDAFLESLSSGQLLCVAYNAGVRRSKKPWGYVNKDGIHDIIALAASEGNEKKGWTFRRTDNLRLWVGALKLRYLLPIVVPNVEHGVSPASSPAPTQTRFPPGVGGGPPIAFDAKVVARREEGWEEMLEAVLARWVTRVVVETRGEA
ncbi:hypothetical protein BDZ89DRAFT_1068125 [Hymenopellis radicata]|nr:hypothetical protein BDZ89DRAFT_1068125 [Hymenopellis radicata]